MKDEVKERTIKLSDETSARISKEYVELFKPTKDFPLTMNEARTLAAALVPKIMRN